MEEIHPRIELLYTTAAVGPRFSIHLLQLGISSSHVKFIVADLSSNVTHIIQFLYIICANAVGANSISKFREKLENLGILFQFVECYVADETITDEMGINRRDLYILDLIKIRAIRDSTIKTIDDVIVKLKSYYNTCQYLTCIQYE